MHVSCEKSWEQSEKEYKKNVQKRTKQDSAHCYRFKDGEGGKNAEQEGKKEPGESRSLI